jgi:hypothetical protein
MLTGPEYRFVHGRKHQENWDMKNTRSAFGNFVYSRPFPVLCLPVTVCWESFQTRLRHSLDHNSIRNKRLTLWHPLWSCNHFHLQFYSYIGIPLNFIFCKGLSFNCFKICLPRLVLPKSGLKLRATEYKGDLFETNGRTIRYSIYSFNLFFIWYSNLIQGR